MAFNYAELTKIKNDISNDANSLSTKLSNFSELIADNVNNKDVWDSETSHTFKKDWDTFETEGFPEYKATFNKEVSTLESFINAWQQAEK